MTSSSVDVLSPPSGQTSFSGIPSATFVEDVDRHMKGEEGAEERLKLLDEQHQKYKFMESNLVSRRRRLKSQIPDISASLAMIDRLKEKREKDETHFLLADQVYAKAEVPATEKVLFKKYVPKRKLKCVLNFSGLFMPVSHYSDPLRIPCGSPL